jgi:hypothetical protein
VGCRAHSQAPRPLTPRNLRRAQDLFSSTGLNLIGSSVFSMSVAQARDFYGHLESIFERKLSKDVEKVLKSRLDNAFDFRVPEEVYTVTTALLMRQHAQQQVAQIITFMTGIPPPAGASTHAMLAPEAQLKRGPARCLALLYRGKNAIETVRRSVPPREAASSPACTQQTGLHGPDQGLAGHGALRLRRRRHAQRGARLGLARRLDARDEDYSLRAGRQGLDQEDYRPVVRRGGGPQGVLSGGEGAAAEYVVGEGGV